MGCFCFSFKRHPGTTHYTPGDPGLLSHTKSIILQPFSTGSKRQYYRDKDLHVFGAYRDRYDLTFLGAVAEGDQWGADAFNGSLTYGVGDRGCGNS